MSNGTESEQDVVYEYVDEPAEEKKVEPKRMDAPAHPVRIVRRVVKPATVPVAVEMKKAGNILKDANFPWKELFVFAAGIIVGLLV